jgi:hypothetical protein
LCYKQPSLLPPGDQTRRGLTAAVVRAAMNVEIGDDDWGALLECFVSE